LKLIHSLPLALAIAALSAPALAAEKDRHKDHHPAGAASAPDSKSPSAKSRTDMARMENQMKAMREMHDKMTAAPTPEARNALMAEHMKTMQESMTMMNGTSPGGMSGMGGMGNMKGDMTARHQMMEKRMEMMQSMMQMMMDRLPAAPEK